MIGVCRYCPSVMSIRTSENGFQRISTRGYRADQRFAFWRSLFSRIDIDLVDAHSIHDFSAELLRYEAPDGSSFGYGANDDTIAHFAKPESDFFLLSLPLSGSVDISLGTNTSRTIAAGEGLVIVDGMQSLTSISHGHSQLNITIPRDRAMEALDGDLSALGDGLRVLPHKDLVTFLVSHLQMMARDGESLSSISAQTAMKVASDLALGVLAKMKNSDKDLEGLLHSDALHAAACRYIGMNIANPDLTAIMVASAVGCSRAQLYRIFSTRDQSVGEFVHIERMKRASELLVSCPHMPVERIAHQCGYVSSAGFARAFRRYAGVSASLYRSAHMV